MKHKNVILITGASSGIGKATALRLVADGHTVYGAARRVEKMKDIINAGGHTIAMDVTSQDQVAAAVERVIGEQGRIDVLINNAGYPIYGAVEDVDLDAARRQFDVNLFGLAEITKRVLPHMRHQGSGRILNLSSMGGKIYTPMGAWYHASKHALEGWSDCLRLELKPFNIDVVIIEPGIIRTEFGDVLVDGAEQIAENSPYRNMMDKIVQATKDSYEKGTGSPPEKIAGIISKAVSAKRPRTRYACGYMAKPLMFVRKYLGDRIFDRLITSQI